MSIDQIKPLLNCDGFGLIGLHVGDDATPLLEKVLPTNDPLLLIVLSRLLTLALSQHGAKITAAGTLANGMLLIATHDPLAAAEIIESELQATALLAYCQIGVSTLSGWLCFYPHRTVNLNYLLDRERFELKENQLSDALENLVKLLDEIRNKHKRQRGDSSAKDGPAAPGQA
jgi:hypothetical protein